MNTVLNTNLRGTLAIRVMAGHTEASASHRVTRLQLDLTTPSPAGPKKRGTYFALIKSVAN